MTTVIILMYGAAAILLISAVSTDPNTKESPSILDTLMEIWNGTPNASSPVTSPGGVNKQPGGITGPAGTGDMAQHAATFWLKQRGY